MTGCYPKRAMPIQHVLFPASSVGLNPDEVTVAEVLRSAGYATACIGKWHLGDQPEFLPTRQGFDEYYGLPYSNDMGPPEDGAKSNPGRPLPQPKNRQARPIPPDGIRGPVQPPLPLLENETVIERVRADQQTTITHRYANRAADYIANHKEKPFFLYLPHTAVHFPLYPGLEFRGRSGHGLFSDWVQEADWATGVVFAALREHGLQDRTLVIFTSDNGGATRHGASNKPLRGAKGSTLEGGVRVPTIVWWPGHVPAGTSTSAITTTMDILPTLAAIAGAKVPTDRTIDGLDITAVLTGEAEGPRRDFFYFRGHNLQAVRRGPWKLHLAGSELYNLSDDIGESRNVADANPEPVRELREMAAAMDKDLGRTGTGPGCRPLGRVANPLPLIHPDGTIRAGFEPR